MQPGREVQAVLNYCMLRLSEKYNIVTVTFLSRDVRFNEKRKITFLFEYKTMILYYNLL